MPDSGDVVLVTQLPEFAIIEGFLQFTLISGSRTHVFRLSKHRGRNACHVCLRVLDQDMARPSNICPLRVERAPPHG